MPRVRATLLPDLQGQYHSLAASGISGISAWEFQPAFYHQVTNSLDNHLLDVVSIIPTSEGGSSSLPAYRV